MSPDQAFNQWIRRDFAAINTALEELYFAQDDAGQVEGVGEDLKAELVRRGEELLAPLLAEGRTHDGFDGALELLGDVGMYLGALRRHELTNPDRETVSPFATASALALHVGVSIGMAPRFATAHLATHNRAVGGLRRSFTMLHDEFLFIDENTRGIFGLQSAAYALTRLVPLGATSPVADVLFAEAEGALRGVAACNARLFEQLDVARFFYCVRPYYKPYRVGRQVYRGANAGDFAGINEIDLMLGLCRASDPYYAQLLHEKLPYMLPAEQLRLRESMSRRSILDQLLDHAETDRDAPWFIANVRAFLGVCDAFGAIAAQHHDQLVSRFVAGPAQGLAQGRLQGITASGPSLEALLRSLEILRDLRMAAPRDDIASRHADMARLRAAIGA